MKALVALPLPVLLLLSFPHLASSLSLPSHHQHLPRQDLNTTSPFPLDSVCSLSADCQSAFCYGGLCTDPESVRGQVADGGQCFEDATCENFAAGTSTCQQGVCTPDLPPYVDGHACQADADCSSASCQNGVCAAAQTTGCDPACGDGFICNIQTLTCESTSVGCDPACSDGQVNVYRLYLHHQHHPHHHRLPLPLIRSHRRHLLRERLLLRRREFAHLLRPCDGG
ncbi:hypothetical protein BCR35DRAFT_171885 [Leucosporidium creatinivorum]|uniref:Dickkopf N-terminal cysteine-rich domain-containing protein n=1 Tax=Leucosporidium creatinivorum TaxID=106004 RepID=A0A1Y2E8Z8_9BASI|nr:hypothetical protein BCR35DRAFT_171885 [Leucosporidium creatinivorum]